MQISGVIQLMCAGILAATRYCMFPVILPQYTTQANIAASTILAMAVEWKTESAMKMMCVEDPATSQVKLLTKPATHRATTNAYTQQTLNKPVRLSMISYTIFSSGLFRLVVDLLLFSTLVIRLLSWICPML